MSPTIMHMVGFGKPSQYSTISGKTNCVSGFTFDEIVNPPKNVAGKQCVVSAVYCNYETNKTLLAANRVNTAYFGWNLNSLWSHLYSSPNTPFLQPALGARDLVQERYYDLGPRVIQMPNGPTPIRFLCRQQNLDGLLTESFYDYDCNVIYGSSTYASVTITAGSNDTIVLTDGSKVDTITIPAGTYATISSFVNAVSPLMPSPYFLRIDGNSSYTRLMIAAKSTQSGIFTCSGTAKTALGLFTTASVLLADYITMTVVLHLTPVE